MLWDKEWVDIDTIIDEEDVKSTLIDVGEKIRELEEAYGNLHEIFKTISNDDEAYLQHLEEESVRKEFYNVLNGFLKNFKDCSVLQDFVHEFEHLGLYRRELKKYMELPVKFEPQKLYFFPTGDDWLKLDDSPGREIIYLLASPEPIKGINIKIDQLKKSGIDNIKKIFPGIKIQSFNFKHE